MSRVKKPTQQEVDSEKPGAGSDSPAGSSVSKRTERARADEERPRSRGLLWAAVIVTLLWVSVLAILAATTGNPVLLNRQQIHEADCVVTATVTDPAAGKVDVQRVWKGRPPAPLRIDGLEKARADRGETYLIPLSHAGGDLYRVTGSTLPRGPRLIYPAVPQALEQLRTILAEPTDRRRRENGTVAP